MEENKEITEQLQYQVQLMEVRGDQPHRMGAYRKAAGIIRALERPVAELIAEDSFQEINGIGPGIQQWVEEFLRRGTTGQLESLLEELPAGVVEMLEIKGLGPKRVAVIWREMGIETVGALYFACIENRLARAKGFGAKTQEKLLATLEFLRDNQQRFLYAHVRPHADATLALLKEHFGPAAKIALTGDMRRQLPVVEKIQILAAPELYRDLMLLIVRSADYELMTAGSDLLIATHRGTNIQTEFLFRGIDFYRELFLTTGPEAHTERVPLEDGHLYASEEEIYELARINFVPPVLREGREEVRMAYRNQLPQVIEANDLRGLLHAHSTWSDGRHELKDMAAACRELGFEYLGITDHSRSAFYANGLSVERVAQQQAEIDALNAGFGEFRILKGIESDILPDGSLDYDSMTLASFDFVIASVHSQLEMDETKATERLLKAIRNPFTNILGHPTGRLLLARPGYPIDHKTIIEACALYDVAIELNCNPQRMDLDWRWIRFAVEQGVMISINPDAHRKESLEDYRWGIPVAQKGLLTPALTLNAMGLAEIEEFFLGKRKRRIA